MVLFCPKLSTDNTLFVRIYARHSIKWDIERFNDFLGDAVA